MSTQLYILQHGHAVPRQENELRPLSKHGESDIARLAQQLAERQVQIQRILHSGKLRAEQSAQIISEYLGQGVEARAIAGICPNDSAEAFIDSLDMGGGNTLVISHMPFVSRLCSVLLTGSVDTGFDFTPGTLACLNHEVGVWSMAYMNRPQSS